MPQVPVYEQKASLPATQFPTIPANIASAPMEALEKAGNTLTDVGSKWAERVKLAQDQATVSQLTSDAAVKVNDYRNQLLDSPLFNTDPAQARQQWDRQVREMGQGYVSQIKDPYARQLFTSQFDKLAASHTASFANEVRKQQVGILGGAARLSLDNFTNAAASSPDDNTFHENMKNGLAAINGAMASGAIAYPAGAGLIETFRKNAFMAKAKNVMASNDPATVAAVADQIRAKQGIWEGMPETIRGPLAEAAQARSATLLRGLRVEDDKQQAEQLRFAKNNAVQQASSYFNTGDPVNDTLQADIWLNKPETAKMLGLVDKLGQPDKEAIAEVTNRIQTDYTHQKVLREDRQKTDVNKINSDFVQKYSQRQLSTNEVFTATLPDGSPLPSNIQEHWTRAIDAQAAGLDKTDPKIKGDILDRIWVKKNMTDPGQLVPYLGHGLGSNDFDALRKDIQYAQDIPNDRWFKLSESAFYERYTKPETGLLRPEAAPYYVDYVQGLAHAVKNGNLQGDAILEQARKMLDVLDDNVYGFGIFGGRKAPAPAAPADFSSVMPPAETQATAPEPVNPYAGAIPQADRDAIAGFLRFKGLPVTDANVLFIYNQKKQGQ